MAAVLCLAPAALAQAVATDAPRAVASPAVAPASTPATAPIAEAPKVEAPGPKPASAAAASAPPPAPAPAAAPVPTKGPLDLADDWIDQTKSPVPWFKWGADLRYRDEYLNSAGLNNSTAARGTKGDETNWQRYRARWWGTLTPVKNMDLNLRIEWEGRHFSAPDGTPTYNKEDVLIDAANVKLTNVLDSPLTLTLGRQDIILGDGWLVLEGTPYDGSRTIFFDAARGTYELKEINTTADFIYINNSFDSFGMLPPLLRFNPLATRTYQIEQNEQAFILWLTNRSIKNTEINGYYIYKENDRVVPMPFGGDDGHIHTFGARVAGQIDDHWKYRAEGATEFGTRNGQDLLAFGFNSRLTYTFNDPLANELRVSYEYLSGDNPNTKGTNEAWVPLWGRWPQWSELYVYTVAFTREQRIAEITNLQRLAFGWSMKPTDKLTLAVDYHLLFANENTQAGMPGFSSGGAFRGELLTMLATYQFTRHLKGHLLTEFFWPGNFYAAPNNNMATMLRGELYFTW
jgi:hypothetical protein